MNHKLSKYISTVEIDDCFLIYSTLTCKMLKVSKDLWFHLQNENIDELPAEILKNLISLRIILECNIDEFELVNSENLGEINSSILYEVIQPSAFCQMGCFYCGQKHENINLDKINAKKIVTAIETKIQNHNYKELIIGWFGGEPLIAIDQIRYITNLLKIICIRKEIDYTAKIVTNGLLLTKENIVLLVNELHVKRIEITIDGIESTHNNRRNLKNNNKGTFKKIIKNIKELISYNNSLEIAIRCNVDRTNHNSVIPLINYLDKEGILKKVVFYTAKVYEFGDKTNKEFLINFDYAEEEKKWLKHLLTLNYLPSLLPKRKHEVCLATRDQSNVYDAYGNVFKCTEIPFTKNFKESKYFLGKINNSQLNSNINFRNQWLESIKNKKSFCLDCNFYPVCGGACPKSWEDSNIPCPSFKFNMEDRIKIHYDLIQRKHDQ